MEKKPTIITFPKTLWFLWMLCTAHQTRNHGLGPTAAGSLEVLLQFFLQFNFIRRYNFFFEGSLYREICRCWGVFLLTHYMLYVIFIMFYYRGWIISRVSSTGTDCFVKRTIFNQRLETTYNPISIDLPASKALFNRRPFHLSHTPWLKILNN